MGSIKQLNFIETRKLSETPIIRVVFLKKKKAYKIINFTAIGGGRRLKRV